MLPTSSSTTATFTGIHTYLYAWTARLSSSGASRSSSFCADILERLALALRLQLTPRSHSRQFTDEYITGLSAVRPGSPTSLPVRLPVGTHREPSIPRLLSHHYYHQQHPRDHPKRGTRFLNRNQEWRPFRTVFNRFVGLESSSPSRTVAPTDRL